MRSIKSVVTKRKALTSLLSAAFVISLGFATTADAVTPPTVSLPTYTFAQQEGNFLTFPGNTVPLTPAWAKAYYNAIDPLGNKLTFTQWMVEAGFIGQESDWHSTGAQIIKTTLDNAGVQPNPTGNHPQDDNVIYADSHMIAINNADLGFVRNQFVRCKPSCNAKNPIIYTYLENYPYDALKTEPFGFPNQAEVDAAITGAIANRTSRIADVAFVWGPPPDGSSPTSRYGQIYAYVFHQANPADPATISETRNWFTDPTAIAGLNARTACTPFPGGCPPLFPIVGGTGGDPSTGDPFSPELDALGFKQNPAVCFMCHGGNPRGLTSTGQYPSQGRSSGFKFLPLDNDNLLFPSSGPLTRTSQELQIKRYNQAVLMTQGAAPVATSNLNGLWKIPKFTDAQGVTRTSHAVEVILGWYGGTVANPVMPNATQNSQFIPVGWREAAHGGTAPAGSEDLYVKAVGPSCRACHSQRESDIDFGTVGSFDANKGDILELVLGPACDSYSPPPGKVVMPAAKRTFDRFWLHDQDQYIATHFGFASTTDYCAKAGQ